jgi:hypothetical protein
MPIAKSLSYVFASLLLTQAGPSTAEEVSPSTATRVHHVVIVWLKEHGSAAARQRYIGISRAQAKLPMVTRYQVGTALPGGREVVDDSYDIAIVASFENRAALEAYLQHPEHRQVVDEGLKPLVDRFVVYDFAEVP